MLDVLLVLLIIGLRLGPRALFEAATRGHRENQRDLPLTGREVARALLDRAGLRDVRVIEDDATPDFDDYYDPAAKTVRLAPRVAHGRSVAAIAVAAHEVGHAMQDARGDPAFRRLGRVKRLSAIVDKIWIGGAIMVGFLPLVGAPRDVVFLLLAAGLFLSNTIDVVARLRTLPAEWGASFAYALPALLAAGMMPPRHQPAARFVLTGAALTYAGFAALGALVFAGMVFAFLR